MKTAQYLFILSAMLVAYSFAADHKKPTLFLIGDSTVRNGDGTGSNGQRGWGSFIGDYFDTTKIAIRNHAMGGRSSRTFITEGRWDAVLSSLHKGDYVLIQFGHNDSSPLDDTARARGTIAGTGDEQKDIYNPIRKVNEVVHTYGWYLRRYIRDAKAKGAIVIICSPVSRNEWKDGMVVRTDARYADWGKDVAASEKVSFIELNDLTAIAYTRAGPANVQKYFPADKVHTDKKGAQLNASIVASAIRRLPGNNLKKFLK